jgi:hypothetical protein
MPAMDITLKNFKDDGKIEKLVREKMDKIEKVCPKVTSCHVFIEQMTNPKHNHHSYHVRIAIAFPPHHEVIITRDPAKGGVQEQFLTTIVKDAFIAARRRIQELSHRQKGHARGHKSIKSSLIESPEEE